MLKRDKRSFTEAEQYQCWQLWRQIEPISLNSFTGVRSSWRSNALSCNQR